MLLNRKIKPNGTLQAFTTFLLALFLHSDRNSPKIEMRVFLSSRRKKYLGSVGIRI
jgi:hypothetical protein